MSREHAPRSLGAMTIVAVSAAGACGGDLTMPANDRSPPTHRFEDVTPAQWEALAARRIFFGHQSVGNNIVAGIESVMEEHPGIGLRVAETTELSAQGEPGLYHARIGRNGDPASKADAFEGVALAGRPDLAMLKYCYVDVNVETDPDALFADYVRRIETLRERDPAVTVVHLTMPLTTVEPGGWRLWLKRLRGRVTKRELNSIRNRYNSLLREAYAGREPLFDIAGIESTLPDGSRSAFVSGGDTIYALHEGFTNDGGHLNEVGRRRVAESFLAFLANLSAPPAET